MTHFHTDWTREQREAVARVYERDVTVAKDLVEFAKGFVSYGDYIGGMWKGMFLGIEKDGYTHS